MPKLSTKVNFSKRTLASWQAAGGSSLLVIGKSLGHRSTSATAIYARLSDNPVRESVEKATRSMMAAVSGERDDGN